MRELPQLSINIEALDQALVSVYRAENEAHHEKSFRDCHSAKGIGIYTKDQALFFNLHHQRLAGALEDKSTVRVTIEENKGPISQVKRATLYYPKTWQAIKWSLLSLGLAGLIFFTGGLGVIPLMGGVVAKLGLLSVLAAAPLAGGALAGLWYGLFKPLSHWAINRFFYPMFHVRNLHSIDVSITGSPRLLATGLGGKPKSDGPNISPTENMEYSEIFTKRPGVKTTSTITPVNDKAGHLLPF